MESNKTTKHILKQMPSRHPVDGTFELTVRCNLHCKMCLFRHDDSENTKIIEHELSTKEWIDLGKQVAEAGTFSLLLTGGEPMLRLDFCEIYEGIYQHGFHLTLYTNATLVTPKIMDTLKKYPPHKIGVTIYGASADTYEKVTGNANAFEQMKSGVKQLMTLPSHLEFRTTIIKDNYNDLKAMEELVHTQFQSTSPLIQSTTVTQSVRGACADVTTCRLDPEENVRLKYRRSIQELKKKVGNSFDEKKISFHQIKNPDISNTSYISLLGCDAGMTSYTVSWNGKLLGCQMLGVFSTNTKEQGFLSAWKEFPHTINLPKLNETCFSCKLIASCSCCIASRYAETNDLAGLPKYVCTQTKFEHGLLKEE